MSHTVIGIFEYTSEAQSAKEYLVNNGFNDSDVDINTSGSTTMGTTGEYENRNTADYSGNDSTGYVTSEKHEDVGDRIGNFFRNMFGSDDDDDRTTNNHIEAGRRGTIVTVHAQSSEQAEKAAEILDNYGAVDVNEFADRARSGNVGNYEANRTTGMTDTTNTDVNTTGKIPVIKEDLQVGKREVETGGVRLRSRIIERPVEESIRLREEHVNIERTPVDRPATAADFANFKEGTVEVREHAEKPVVNKEARVVEEVGLNKEVSEREETVRDTVRHTEVNTENLTGTNTTNTDVTNTGNTNTNITNSDMDTDADRDRLLP